TDVRFTGNNALESHSKFVFTDLTVSEPAGGPLQKNLKMPAPLDVVLVALEDPSGGITIPLSVPVKEGQLNRGAIIGSAVGAMVPVMATAVASAPIKVGGALTSIVGGDSEKKKGAAAEAPIEIDFAPGVATSSAAVTQTLSDLVKRL